VIPPSPIFATQARYDPVVMQQLRDKFLERCNAYKVTLLNNQTKQQFQKIKM
jgi:hypothetical protein